MADQPLPPVPKHIEVEIDVPQKIEPPVFLPYYYHSMSSFWLYFRVDPDRLAPFLEDTGLKPALFDGHGLVNLDFMNYTSHNGNSLAATDELELNIVAYPAARADDVPTLTAEEFLLGNDQTKTIGHYRLHVVCDNKFAIAAGRALYGENKFYGTFDYNVPSLNNPPTTTWHYVAKAESGEAMLTVDANIAMLHPQPANPSSVIDYSMLDGRLVGSRRNFWAVVDSYDLPAKERKGGPTVTLAYGPGDSHHFRSDLETLLGRTRDGQAATPAFAAQVLQTPPVIAEARAYYAGF